VLLTPEVRRCGSWEETITSYHVPCPSAETYQRTRQRYCADADAMGLEPNLLSFSWIEVIWAEQLEGSPTAAVRIPKYLIRCPNA
jgi:hypothetical protein